MTIEPSAWGSRWGNFREAGAAYPFFSTSEQAEQDALEAALKQLELSTDRSEKVDEMAGLMKEQQRRMDDLNGRMIRLETVLEIALKRSSAQPIL